ncbi:MAG: YbhB/YbcL family Raf kinase inhibitor-like protein [Chthoniobacteraceae bacterium]|jgi:Raf kinase inhibitor-like YbhB/YbcL family protein
MRFPRFAGPFLALLLAAYSCQAAPKLGITSPYFAEGATIPSQFTCEGANKSPDIEISGVPAGAKSLVLIVDDPDAPSRIFTHWLVWNISPDTRKIASGAAPSGAVEGTNDFGSVGYSGPCPPSGTHRYFFRLSALDTTIQIATGASRRELEEAMRGHVIGSALLMGRYAKTGGQ